MAEARFDGMVEYIEALTQAAAGKQLQDMEPLLQSCLLDIDRAPPITLEVAARMLKKLATSKVPKEWRTGVVEVVQKKVQVGAEAFPISIAASCKKQPQRCNHLCNYFLQTEWDSFKSNGMANKITVVAQRMASLGLVNPTEQTFVHAVAVMYLSSHKGPVEEMMVNGTHALQVLRDLKSLLKGQKGFGHSGVLNYPQDPAELPSHLLLKAFGQKKPAPSPLDAQSLLFLQQQLPARDTHTRRSVGVGARKVPRKTLRSTWAKCCSKLCQCCIRTCWGSCSAGALTRQELRSSFCKEANASVLRPQLTSPQHQVKLRRQRLDPALQHRAASASP